MKAYDLKEFVRSEHVPKYTCKKSFKTYSLPFLPMGLPGLFKALFINTDVLFVGSIGVIAVAAIGLEHHLAKIGKDYKASIVSVMLSVGVPVIAFGVMIYAMYIGLALF